MTHASLYHQNLISVSSLTAESVYEIFDRAQEMKQLVSEKGGDLRLQHKMMAALFYEPSSRTMSSFITAMQRLGGGIIPLPGMKDHSSAVKGETITDTAKVFSSYADVLVIRHPEVGVPAALAASASVPVINAGDGAGEHPTQALLDCFTISSHRSSFSSLSIALIGDLKYGRTVHSLSRLLCLLGVRSFVCISPSSLRMPEEIISFLTAAGAQVTEVEQLESHISEVDVVYMTRVQKERFSDLSEYERVKHAYVLSAQTMTSVRHDAMVLHPLPRVGEILEEVDADPRALYLTEQMKNGLYVRMAIIDMILR